MKTRLTTLMALAALWGPAAPALAANGARQDSSMLLVWGFLGMCALIVIVQLLPAMFMAFGMVKGLLTGSRERQVEPEPARDE